MSIPVGGGAHHDADVVSVVQRQRSVHLQQVVLRPEETLQVLRVKAHHQGNVVKATEGCKCILKYRLCLGVHFTDLKNLWKENPVSTSTAAPYIAVWAGFYLFLRDKSAWSVSKGSWDSDTQVLEDTQNTP